MIHCSTQRHRGAEAQRERKMNLTCLSASLCLCASVLKRIVAALLVTTILISPLFAQEIKAGRQQVASGEYKGRRIAQTMHYTGAEWLTRDNREQEERCSLMLTSLGVKRGMTICDMGCGNGFYTLQLAKMTGLEGRVYAVDIQAEMLRMLKAGAAEERLRNITPILSTATDPKLPKGKIDLVLLVDVYHEFSHPEEMLAA